MQPLCKIWIWDSDPSKILRTTDDSNKAFIIQGEGTHIAAQANHILINGTEGNGASPYLN